MFLEYNEMQRWTKHYNYHSVKYIKCYGKQIKLDFFWNNKWCEITVIYIRKTNFITTKRHPGEKMVHVLGI